MKLPTIKSRPSGGQIKRAGGGIMHFIGWIMIFAFTGTCTILLLRQYAPATTPWLPYAGLAAFEFGVIHWLHYHRHSAKNALQFLVALAMTAISAIAIAACTATEMISWFGVSGDISLAGWVQGAIFWLIIGVIVANVLAFILCSLFEPGHLSMWLLHDSTEMSEDARDYSPDYSPASVANNQQSQLSRVDIEAITGELVAIMEARNTSPLSQPQMQHSGNMKKTASAHRAAPDASTPTQK